MNEAVPPYVAAFALTANEHTHAGPDAAFAELVAAANGLENHQPADGKDVKYYRDRYSNSELIRHKRWFAAQLYTYCERLTSS